jgi:hypothetical protein
VRVLMLEGEIRRVAVCTLVCFLDFEPYVGPGVSSHGIWAEHGILGRAIDPGHSYLPISPSLSTFGNWKQTNAN